MDTAVHIDPSKTMDQHKASIEEGRDTTEAALSDALASLSLTTELDSALLSHLNLLDKYMFHMECLSQHFRLVVVFLETLTQAFFELAQANRNISSFGGRRIDETGFDQRMQALRRMYTCD